MDDLLYGGKSSWRSPTPASIADQQPCFSIQVPCQGCGWPPPAVATILTQPRGHGHGKTRRLHMWLGTHFRARLSWATVAMTAGQIGNGSEDADCGRWRRAWRDDGHRLPAARGLRGHHL